MFTIETHPRRDDGHHKWADYIELLCVQNIDGEVSTTYIIDRITEGNVLDIAGNVLDIAGEYQASELSTRWVTDAEDWFRHLQFRQEIFQDFYPFILTDSGDTLQLKAHLSSKHYLYIYLLLSSNLSYTDGGTRHTLTNDFEYLCSVALKNCLPNWNIYIFGKGKFSHDRYRGNIWTKLNQLAKDINDILLVKESDLKPTSTGDEGLDIVGWVKGDDLSGIFVFFCQCACTEDWVNKQHTVSFSSWRQKLKLMAGNSSLTCIPFCYRTTTGEWYQQHKIETILLDRLRITQLLESTYDEIEHLDSFNVIENVLEEKESLF